MGCVLSSPVELIRVQRHGSSAFRCAVAEMQGWRVGHEDAHEIRCDSSSCTCFVLDGHGGDGAANFGAPELAREFQSIQAEAAKKASTLPDNDRIEKTFSSVDDRLSSFVAANPEKDSGSTVVGALILRQDDGFYSLKLLNCGDSRGVVVRGPGEKEEETPPTPVHWPQHIQDLAAAKTAALAEMAALGDNQDEAKSDASPVTKWSGVLGKLECNWPVVVESVDHKPDHPTERGRIEAVGGYVSEEDPPRLDGNLAVSRGLGDFEYKRTAQKPASEQKVSCVPDVYEVSGLRPGSFCVLACDGIWDVMDGDFVANFVRDALQNPGADLGDIAAELVQTSLRRNSRDNVTLLIVQFVDGTDWESQPDEIKNYEKLADTDLEEDVRKQYQAFLRRVSFQAKPDICAECSKWLMTMQQCPCKQVYYCTRQCQKKGWKVHKSTCSAASNSTSSSPSNPKSSRSGKK